MIDKDTHIGLNKGPIYDEAEERAMVLDRFLRDDGLSALALEYDIDGFSGVVGYRNRRRVLYELAEHVETAPELEDTINSFGPNARDFRWFLGGTYMVEWLEDGVKVLRQRSTERRHVYENAKSFAVSSEAAGKLLKGVASGVEHLSYVENDLSGALRHRTVRTDRIDELHEGASDLTGVIVSEEGRVYRMARELASTITAAVNSALGDRQAASMDASSRPTTLATGERNIGSAERSGERSSGREDVSLEVSDTHPGDGCRGIARVRPAVLRELDVNPGEPVEILGDETTSAKVWRLRDNDDRRDVVRLSPYNRYNADVDTGEEVAVRKAHAPEATRVVFAPQDGHDTVEEVVRRSDADSLLDWTPSFCVTEGDVVPFSRSDLFAKSPDEAFPLVAVETEPADTVVLSIDTEVDVSASAR